MNTTKKIYVISFFILIMSVWETRADYITLIQADKCETIIEIRIERDFVRIAYEIGEKDAQWFKNIIPRKYYADGYKEEDSSHRNHLFFKNDFPVQIDGRLISGKVTKVDLRERIARTSLYTGKVDTTSIASKYVVFVEVIYPFSGKPKIISFTPPIQKGYDVTFANIGFITYHKKIPVNDIRYLGVKETINLNWNDPWYSYFDNKNIRRHHNNSIMSFLYVDPYEVRHEILARVKDLEYWIDLEYDMDDTIKIIDQEELKTKVANFLISKNIVDIDGEKPVPLIDKVHFVEVNMYGIQVVENAKPMDYSSAIIGVIFAYPNPGIPKRVAIDWELFNDQIKSVPNTATDPAGPMKYMLSPDDHILVWQNFLKKYKLPTISEVTINNASLNIPFITLLILIPIVGYLFNKRKNIKDFIKRRWGFLITGFLFAIITIPFYITVEIPFMQKKSFSTPEAKQLVSELLKNTYRAFDFRKESDIYDKLAVSNTGELLSDVYLQTRKSMVIENQGGIRAKVKTVDILEVEQFPQEEEGISYNCKWQVSGTVGHWGHIHRRTNQYQAIINVKPVDDVWKMYGLDMIEEIRL
jgi:hypothetical protein